MDKAHFIAIKLILSSCNGMDFIIFNCTEFKGTVEIVSKEFPDFMKKNSRAVGYCLKI